MEQPNLLDKNHNSFRFSSPMKFDTASQRKTASKIKRFTVKRGRKNWPLDFYRKKGLIKPNIISTQRYDIRIFFSQLHIQLLPTFWCTPHNTYNRHDIHWWNASDKCRGIKREQQKRKNKTKASQSKGRVTQCKSKMKLEKLPKLLVSAHSMHSQWQSKSQGNSEKIHAHML